MRSRSLIRLPALLLVLLLILAAGCSDSGDDDDASGDDDDTEQVDDTTGGDDDADDDADDDSGSQGTGGGGEFAQFCGAFRGVLESYSASPDSAEEAFNAYVAALKELDPPDVIEGDWQTAVATFDTPDVALTPDESAAFDRVDSWTVENCGFDPDEVSGSGD